MTPFHTIGILITLVSLFSYINYRWLKWHATIGTMFIALLFSVGVVISHYLGLQVVTFADYMLMRINFSDVLLHGMLSFFLFAGALHLDFAALKDVRWPVTILAIIGTVISTVLIGGAGYWICQGFGIQISLIHAMIFGALISPTDPIAVLAMLKQSHAPKHLEMKIAGESLFNDGIAVVIFSSLVLWDRAGDVSAFLIGETFVREALGGVLFGFVTGWIVRQLLKKVDDLQIEILLTLALVTGGYTLALAIDVSGPIAMVIAGLMVGRQSENKQGVISHMNLHRFWELVDELLNAILFVLIGLEVCILPLDLSAMELGLLAIPIVLVARLISVWLPMRIIPFKHAFSNKDVAILTWGGLRGGLAIAMALSLVPEFSLRNEMIVITYVVVIFSVIVQGMSFNRLANRVLAS